MQKIKGKSSREKGRKNEKGGQIVTCVPLDKKSLHTFDVVCFSSISLMEWPRKP